MSSVANSSPNTDVSNWVKSEVTTKPTVVEEREISNAAREYFTDDTRSNETKTSSVKELCSTFLGASTGSAVAPRARSALRGANQARSKAVQDSHAKIGQLTARSDQGEYAKSMASRGSHWAHDGSEASKSLDDVLRSEKWNTDSDAKGAITSPYASTLSLVAQGSTALGSRPTLTRGGTARSGVPYKDSLIWSVKEALSQDDRNKHLKRLQTFADGSQDEVVKKEATDIIILSEDASNIITLLETRRAEKTPITEDDIQGYQTSDADTNACFEKLAGLHNRVLGDEDPYTRAGTEDFLGMEMSRTRGRWPFGTPISKR